MKKTLFLLFFLLSTLSVLTAKSSQLKFSADLLHGSGITGKTHTTLIGNAQVSMDTLTIKSNRIELYGKDYRYVKATEGPTGEDTEKGFTFSATSLEYDRTTEIAEFMGAAKIHDVKNHTKTEAERIQYNQKNETLLLQMGVKISSKDIVCESLFALYYRQTALLELTGNPSIKKGKDVFKAARIVVNLNTEDIQLDGKVRGAVTEEKKSK
ncbi:MAG: LptA/OstA family protein [Treponema sp.]